MLAYQANVRASLPKNNWTPYVTGGVGAMSFLKNTNADQLIPLNDTQTLFAINFGAGATYRLNDHWGLRGDFREFTAFPSNNTKGLSTSGKADAIWMERRTVGVAYRF